MDFFVLICHINQLVKNPLAGIMLLLATAAAEVPMSYVRVIEPYSPSRSEPAAFFSIWRASRPPTAMGWDARWRWRRRCGRWRILHQGRQRPLLRPTAHALHHAAPPLCLREQNGLRNGVGSLVVRAAVLPSCGVYPFDVQDDRVNTVE